ncbi:GyrI-like domain-containing protein [Lysinimonas soli]|uniref:GyrI-like domain-containing protein n=1 Tax=Lysinimonas soli TaxID=1074233 RepID=A0ABW0NQC2_9MICO
MEKPVKLDVKADHELYRPPADRFVEVDVPEMPFLMYHGQGSPEGEGFQAAIGALYSMSYGVKFASKSRLGRDYVVPPLEALWWTDDPQDFARTSPEQWRWTAMIRLPDWIDEAFVEQCRAEAVAKSPLAAEVRFERWTEGRSVQILHLGSYADEAPTIARLHQEYLPQHGLVENGHHHEIYLGDPRHSAPERLRTVLRQPVRPA